MSQNKLCSSSKVKNIYLSAIKITLFGSSWCADIKAHTICHIWREIYREMWISVGYQHLNEKNTHKVILAATNTNIKKKYSQDHSCSHQHQKKNTHKAILSVTSPTQKEKDHKFILTVTEIVISWSISHQISWHIMGVLISEHPEHPNTVNLITERCVHKNIFQLILSAQFFGTLFTFSIIYYTT